MMKYYPNIMIKGGLKVDTYLRSHTRRASLETLLSNHRFKPERPHYWVCQLR
jgi:hypothetical protein